MFCFKLYLLVLHVICCSRFPQNVACCMLHACFSLFANILPTKTQTCICYCFIMQTWRQPRSCISDESLASSRRTFPSTLQSLLVSGTTRHCLVPTVDLCHRGLIHKSRPCFHLRLSPNLSKLACR